MSMKQLNTATFEQITRLYGQNSEDFSLAEIIQLLADTNTNIPERTLRRWLSQWIDDGLVTKTGQKRGTRYKLLRSANSAHTLGQLGFLESVEPAKRKALLAQLRDLWTHGSTAIEGNTLSLGDTHSILELGLTISGKPLREHHEIIGHAKAIDLIYSLCSKDSRQLLTKQTLFDLHKAVQLDVVMDIYEPVGQWKVEPNYANSVLSNGEAVIIEYALPQEVDSLMVHFIQTINDYDSESITIKNAQATFAKLHLAFVHIHPFADGNGRLARLIANLPLLKAGLPPLLLDQNKRREYITLLADYQASIKAPNTQSFMESGFWPNAKQLIPFTDFCGECYQSTIMLFGKNAQ